MSNYYSSPDLAATIRDISRRVALLEQQQLGQAQVLAEEIQSQRKIYAESLGEVSTTSSTYVALSGGPSVIIDVPADGFVAVYFECELHATGTGVASAALYEPSDFASGIALLGTTNLSYETRHTADGGTGTTGIGGKVQVAASSGTRTYSIRYANTAASGNSVFFRTRRLWAEVA